MRCLPILTLCTLALSATACAVEPAETGDGPLGSAPQAEIDPGYKDYLIYDVYNVSGALLAQVLVTATDGDGYTANREYWYVATNPTNGESVTFIGGTSEYWTTTPSGLGTLSFTMDRTPTWTAGSYRGYLPYYQAPTGGEFEGLIWQMVDTGGTWSGSITWWSGSGTGNLFGDGVTRALTEGHVSVSGYYFTSSPL
jgi:hypothetical protein